MRHGWLRRTTVAGDRKDYYEMAPDFVAGIVSYRLARWDGLHDLVAAAIPQLGSEPATVRDRLQYLDEAQTFFVRGLRELLSRWDEQQSSTAAR
jgi:hypothetical protein